MTLTGGTITDEQVKSLTEDADWLVADIARIALYGIGRDGAFGSEDRAKAYVRCAEILNARKAVCS